MAKAKDLLKKYGGAYLLTSTSLAIVSFSLCYFLIDNGVDVGSLLGKVGIEVDSTSETGAARFDRRKWPRLSSALLVSARLYSSRLASLILPLIHACCSPRLSSPLLARLSDSPSDPCHVTWQSAPSALLTPSTRPPRPSASRPRSRSRRSSPKRSSAGKSQRMSLRRASELARRASELAEVK